MATNRFIAPTVVEDPLKKKDPMWGDMPSGIGSAYNAVLQNNLTGAAFDPMRAGMQESQARAEANQRAATAGQINAAGLAGQGLGAQVAQGTENTILGNRFANNVAIGVAQNQAQTAMLPEARAYSQGIMANKTGQYNLDQAAIRDPLLNKQLELGNQASQNALNSTAGEGFASYAMTHLDLEGKTPQEMMSDPAFANNAQKLWESSGQTGAVDPNWAAQQYKAATDPNLNNATLAANRQIDQLVAAGQIKPEDAALLKDFNSSGGTQYLKRDANGRVYLDTAQMAADATGQKQGSVGGSAAQLDSAAIQTGDYSSLINNTGDISNATRLNTDQYNTMMSSAQEIPTIKKPELAAGGGGGPSGFGGPHSIEVPDIGGAISIGGKGYVVATAPKTDTTKKLNNVGRYGGTLRGWYGGGTSSGVQYVEVQDARTGERKKLYVNGLFEDDPFWTKK